MIADVVRAYNPVVTYVNGNIYQKTIANLQAMNDSANGVYPKMLPLTLLPNLVHRKIWAWFYSISAGTWSIDVDLVLTLGSQEKFRQRIVHWTTAVTNDKWLFGFSSNGVTASNEQLVVTIANTTTYSVSPHRLNIAADKAYLEIVQISGAAANFDVGLHILSQAGI